MLVVEDPDGSALCVGQASHAWMSGQLARAWGNDAFARPEPYEAVCLGAEQHDVGMAEWDLAPTLERDTGRPTSFLKMPVATHLALWRAAPAKVLAQSPYAALLVSMHGAALYRRRDDGDGPVRAYLDEQRALQDDLLAALGEDPGRAARNQRLLWALDFLSLALLLEGWRPGPVPAPTRPGEPGAELALHGGGARTATVDPWPFAGDRLEVRCQARRLTERYADEPSLHAGLRAARWEPLVFALSPAV